MILAIASGEYTKVAKALAVNVGAGTVWDATAAILAEVEKQSAD